jgi:hypothetical protein
MEPLHIVWLAVIGFGALILVVNAIRMAQRWNDGWFILPALLGTVSLITVLVKIISNHDPEPIASTSIFFFMMGFIILVLLKSRYKNQTSQ